MGKFTRRKFFGYSLLGAVGGMFGWKIWKQNQKGSLGAQNQQAKNAKKWKPITVNSPAKVYFKRIKDGQTLDVWAKETHKLYQKAQFNDIVGKNKLVAVKQHFGERGNKGYIKPEITKNIINEIKKKQGKPSLIETNTLYVGSRANSHDHILTAYEHGFTMENMGAPIVICDGLNGQNQQAIEIPGKHFKAVYIASDVFFFDSMVVLTHVKGHKLSGMGGALKNLGMGLASRAGKLAQHANFKPSIDWNKCTHCGDCTAWCPAGALYMEKQGDEEKLIFDKDVCIGCGQCLTICPEHAIKNSAGYPMEKSCVEKMVEYAMGSISNFNGKVAYVNVVNHISKICDCYAGPNPVAGNDVGVFASTDPVALDMACFDKVKEIHGKDIFKEWYPHISARHAMKYAEKLGMGTTKYKLIES